MFTCLLLSFNFFENSSLYPSNVLSKISQLIARFAVTRLIAAKVIFNLFPTPKRQKPQNVLHNFSCEKKILYRAVIRRMRKTRKISIFQSQLSSTHKISRKENDTDAGMSDGCGLNKGLSMIFESAIPGRDEKFNMEIYSAALRSPECF